MRNFRSPTENSHKARRCTQIFTFVWICVNLRHLRAKRDGRVGTTATMKRLHI